MKNSNYTAAISTFALFLGLCFFSACANDDSGDGPSPAMPVPEVITNEVQDIRAYNAKGGGEIISDGGQLITARGLCWSSVSNPSLNDSISNDGQGAGMFESEMTGLEDSTTYFVRAYATNANGTGYGAAIAFTTLPALTLTDIDGNTYPYVAIGDQNWMAENLKTTTLNDGTPIQLTTTNMAWSGSTIPAYCWPNNDQQGAGATYGAFYNGHAVVSEKLCPTGWHVPGNEEWMELVQFAGGASVAGDKLKAANNTLWTSGGAGTDEYGFRGIPAGYRQLNGDFVYQGEYATFFGLPVAEFTLYGLSLPYDVAGTFSSTWGYNHGLSIRCVMDE